MTSCQALRALRLSRNFGKESALCAGLEHARGDAVILMDADGQHPPSLIPKWFAFGRVLEPMLSKQLSADVGASRYQAKWGPSYSTSS